MQLLLRAIITGFGYKIGAELGRLVAEKLGLKKREGEPAEAELPEGLPTRPPGSEDPEPAPPEDGRAEEDEQASANNSSSAA
jgi:hypothetical protein